MSWSLLVASRPQNRRRSGGARGRRRCWICGPIPIGTSRRG